MKIKSIISLFSLMLLLAGCTREDLSGCFPQSGLQISFSYDPGVSSLPLERADLYLFDADGRFVCSQTDLTGPFSSSAIYTIPLPAGDYTAMAWANLNNSVTLSPTPFIPGQTTLDEARLLLTELSNQDKARTSVYTTGPDKDLYHSIEKNIHVQSDRMLRVEMPLFRNTKHINLAVRFLDVDGNTCQHNHLLNSLIEGSDGIHNFENSLQTCPGFFYRPATQDNISGGYDASFRKMRLFIDESSQIILTQPDAGDAEDAFYRKSLLDLLRGTGYDSQQKLDATHTYNLEFRFRCKDGNLTYATARIFVNGWEYIEINDGV